MILHREERDSKGRLVIRKYRGNPSGADEASDKHKWRDEHDSEGRLVECQLQGRYRLLRVSDSKD